MAVRATNQLKELASAGQPPDITRREFARRTSTGLLSLSAAGCTARAIPAVRGSDLPQAESTEHQNGTGAVFHKYNESRLMRGYRSGFYVSPTDNPTAPIIAGVGAFGQWCLIDYKRKNVMVKLGTDSDYSKPMEELDFRALVSLSENLGKTIA